MDWRKRGTAAVYAGMGVLSVVNLATVDYVPVKILTAANTILCLLTLARMVARETS